MGLQASAPPPEARPVEFGTYQEMGAPRCYLRLRDKKGQPLEKLVPVLASSYCHAIDLKIDPDTGRINLLVERKIGDDPVWWAGEMSAWGKGLKNIGIGAVGDTALALAARPAIDEQGRYHLAGYTCFDTCEPIGEIRTSQLLTNSLERGTRASSETWVMGCV